MCIYVDYFKRFNYIYGHLAGDSALKKIADILYNSLKRPSDFVARYGGEEFIILTSNMTEDQAITYGRHMCEKVEELKLPHIASPLGYLTISCGVSCLNPNLNIAPKELLHQADLALYKAKEMGRNQAVMCNF